MILLFSDYGLAGPYIGQVEAVLHQYAPQERVINLFADVPRNNPKAGAWLLAAYSREVQVGTVFFCVVDPGVGTFTDRPLIMRIDGRWFVGPDNGLFTIIARQGNKVDCWEITWRPEILSDSFHGRDLYAPVCAMLAQGDKPPGEKITWQERYDWQDDLHEIIYIDHFGNCMTGIWAVALGDDAVIRIAGKTIQHAKTFAAVREGEIFWYRNSSNLIEIAVNLGSAARALRVEVGAQFETA